MYEIDWYLTLDNAAKFFSIIGAIGTVSALYFLYRTTQQQIKNVELQREELKLQRKELELQRKAIQDAAKAQNRSADAMDKQIEFMEKDQDSSRLNVTLGSIYYPEHQYQGEEFTVKIYFLINIGHFKVYDFYFEENLSFLGFTFICNEMSSENENTITLIFKFISSCSGHFDKVTKDLFLKGVNNKKLTFLFTSRFDNHQKTYWMVKQGNNLVLTEQNPTP